MTTDQPRPGHQEPEPGHAEPTPGCAEPGHGEPAPEWPQPGPAEPAPGWAEPGHGEPAPHGAGGMPASPAAPGTAGLPDSPDILSAGEPPGSPDLRAAGEPLASRDAAGSGEPPGPAGAAGPVREGAPPWLFFASPDEPLLPAPPYPAGQNGPLPDAVTSGPGAGALVPSAGPPPPAGPPSPAGPLRPAGLAWPADTVGDPVPRSGPRTRTLITFGMLIALIAALLGGLAGGYIGSRRASSGVISQIYSPGPSGTVTNRPPTSVAGIAARILPSVVMIKVNGGTGTGSGFIISGGYIITNNHVVTLDGQVHGAKLQVVFNSGQTASAKLIGTDPYSDIAVIQPQGISHLFAVQLGNSDGVVVGDPVIAVGSPLGLAGTVTSGIVSALNRPVQAGDQTGSASPAYIDAIQTDAPINPGNSGGPLVDARGQVIGVNSAIATLSGGSVGGGARSGSIGLGFAIPINQVRRVAEQLVATGKAIHPIIGAVIDMSYTGDGARIATSSTGGQSPIARNGPAARAGLRPGDVIVAFDGKPVSSADELIVDIRSHQPGDKVRITYRRGSFSHTVTLTLAAASS